MPRARREPGQSAYEQRQRCWEWPRSAGARPVGTSASAPDCRTLVHVDLVERPVPVQRYYGEGSGRSKFLGKNCLHDLDHVVPFST